MRSVGRTGRYDTALPHLQRALRKLEPLFGDEPAQVPALRARVAWTLYHLGRYADSLAMFRRAIESRPDWHGLHAGLGWCYLSLGKRAEARVAFEQALALKPGYEDALAGLKRVHG